MPPRDWEAISDSLFADEEMSRIVSETVDRRYNFLFDDAEQSGLDSMPDELVWLDHSALIQRKNSGDRDALNLLNLCHHLCWASYPMLERMQQMFGLSDSDFGEVFGQFAQQAQGEIDPTRPRAETEAYRQLRERIGLWLLQHSAVPLDLRTCADRGSIVINAQTRDDKISIFPTILEAAYSGRALRQMPVNERVGYLKYWRSGGKNKDFEEFPDRFYSWLRYEIIRQVIFSRCMAALERRRQSPEPGNSSGLGYLTQGVQDVAWIETNQTPAAVRDQWLGTIRRFSESVNESLLAELETLVNRLALISTEQALALVA